MNKKKPQGLKFHTHSEIQLQQPPYNHFKPKNTPGFISNLFWNLGGGVAYATIRNTQQKSVS